MANDTISQRPVDRLIREIIATKRTASEAEVRAILDGISHAEFDCQDRPVPLELVGVEYATHSLRAQVPSHLIHLVKRVLGDGQWRYGVDVAEYLHDLRMTSRVDSAELALYSRRGGHLATAIAPTDEVVPLVRRGPAYLPVIVVVYSADRGIIISGYQASTRERVAIPTDALWLK